MTYDQYYSMFFIFGILSIVMLVIAVILFLKLRIPKVIGDLTGANARKAIQNFRERNQDPGDTVSSSSHVSAIKDNVTDKITNSRRLEKAPHSPVSDGVVIEKTQKLEKLSSCRNSDTIVLSENQQSGDTDLLDFQSDNSARNFEVENDITLIHTEETLD